MKSKNSGSLHLSACAKVFEPGLLFLPLELTTSLGLPTVSINFNMSREEPFQSKKESEQYTISFFPPLPHTEKHFFTRAAIDKVAIRDALNLHDARELLLFVFARKQWVAGVKFGKDTSETPHVDRHVVRHAQDDLGRAVETTLNVSVHLFILQTTASKVNDFDA